MKDTKYFTVVTDLGTKKMLEAVNEGKKVNIVYFAVGDGSGQYYKPDTTLMELKTIPKTEAPHTMPNRTHPKGPLRDTRVIGV